MDPAHLQTSGVEDANQFSLTTLLAWFACICVIVAVCFIPSVVDAIVMNCVIGVCAYSYWRCFREWPSAGRTNSIMLVVLVLVTTTAATGVVVKVVHEHNWNRQRSAEPQSLLNEEERFQDVSVRLTGAATRKVLTTTGTVESHADRGAIRELFAPHFFKTTVKWRVRLRPARLSFQVYPVGIRASA